MTKKRIIEDQVENAIQLLRSIAAGGGDRPQQQKVVNFVNQIGGQVDRLVQPQTTQPGQRVQQQTGRSRDREDNETPTANPNGLDSFEPWRDQLEAEGFTLTTDGKGVRIANGSVAGINSRGTPWFGSDKVMQIVTGESRPRPVSSGGSRRPSVTPSQPGRNINRILNPGQTGGGPKIVPQQSSLNRNLGKITSLAQSKDMSDKNSIQEGLADLADRAERDHEVQMARSDLYKIAKYAIKLHEMLKSVSEAEGIEGWQQAKITKAADYLGSVYHALDYDTKFPSPEIPESVQAKRFKPVMSDSEFKSYKGGLAAKLREAKGVCPDCGKPSYTTLPEEKQKGVDGKVCWKGYKRMGTKQKGGKTVDNCVKM